MNAKKTSGWGGLLIGALMTAFGLIILTGAILRETPMFWHNAGGYPVELRELVYSGFYPALGFYLALLVGLSLAGWKLLREKSRGGALMLLACAINVFLIGIILTVVIWNNLANLLQGLPLHHHPA
jgi:O-antigen ligase